MLERLISVFLFSVVFSIFLIVYFQVNDYSARIVLELNNHRTALQLLSNLSGLRLSGEPGSFIEESLLNNEGFRVELIDLEDNITWFYGEVNSSFVVGIPLLVNNHLGRLLVYAGSGFND